MSDALDIAEKFFRAIEAGDVAAIRAIYAPNAVIWHNNDQLEQSVDENMRVLEWVARNLKNRHYRVKRRVAIPGGFLQQHVLEAETANGPFSMPASPFLMPNKQPTLPELQSVSQPAVLAIISDFWKSSSP